MAFTTLVQSPGLRERQRARLRTMSPGKVLAPASYETLLRRAGFTVLQQRDITREFEKTVERWIAAYDRRRAALTRETSAASVSGARRWYEDRLVAARERLIRRMLYVAER